MNLKDHFPRCSKSFLDANPTQGGLVYLKPNQNATTVNLTPKKAKHEANHQRKIQDSEQREQTPALGSEGKGEASGARCPLIGFTLYRVKLLDWEAKYSSVKDLLDGCVSAGLLDGDREDQIHPNSYVRQVKVKSYAEERTVIEIEL